MNIQDWLLLVLLSVIWGGAFFFAAVAVKELPPLTVVGLRTGLAALSLILVLKWRGESLPFERHSIRAFLTMGLLNNMVPFSLLFWAQTMIPSGLASILNATTPIFSILLAHIFLTDERLAPNKLIGVLLGFIGVVLLLGGDIVRGQTLALLGMLACLGAAFSYGIASVYGRRFKQLGYKPTQVAFGQLTASTLMMIPINLLIDKPWHLAPPSNSTWAAILALAIISTAFAYILFFRILASAGAVNVALVTLLIPLSAILLGTLILGETLLPRHYAGMSLIAIGLLAIDGRVSSLFKRR
ncbi:MAG: DMT family transporter [Rhodobacteraceae bacterium]|nr:DMT family transporter [Paracoccaceae bacterium]